MQVTRRVRLTPVAVAGILPRASTGIVTVEARTLERSTTEACARFSPCCSFSPASGPAPISPTSAVRSNISPKFTVEVNGYGYDWDNIGRFVLPGETLALDVPDNAHNSGWVAAAGELVEVGGKTGWVAPQEPGLYPVIVTSGVTVKRINAFVMVPYDSLDKKGYLKGVQGRPVPEAHRRVPELHEADAGSS